MIFLAIAAAIVALDQLIKFYATANLAGVGEVRLIPHVLHLIYSRNDGASLGFLSGQRWILVGCSALMAVVILWALFDKRAKLAKPEKLCLAAVLGGAVGNLIDRVATGEVVDMLFFPWIGKIPLLPDFICNFADIAVVFGAIAFIVLYGRREMIANKKDAQNG